MSSCEGFRKQYRLHLNCALNASEPCIWSRFRCTTDQGKRQFAASCGMGGKKQKSSQSKWYEVVDERNISNGHGSKHRCWVNLALKVFMTDPQKAATACQRPYVTSLAVNDDGRREWRRERHARVPRPIYRRRVVAVKRHRKAEGRGK